MSVIKILFKQEIENILKKKNHNIVSLLRNFKINFRQETKSENGKPLKIEVS